jgi:hypothetical protein
MAREFISTSLNEYTTGAATPLSAHATVITDEKQGALNLQEEGVMRR